MPPTNPEITKLSETAYQAYINWRQKVLNDIGGELAAKMPNFYGSVQFNLQGGKVVNTNMTDCTRPKKA